MDKLTLEKFEEASEIVKEVTAETKLVFSEFFSEQSGNKVYLKPENMQRTGAYKVRGAYYKISQLPDEDKKKGIITASAGNHAQGVAYASKLAKIKATVCMPTTTPLMKINRTKGYGAEVVLEGMSLMKPVQQHIALLMRQEQPLFIHLMTWKWQQVREPLQWRLLRNFQPLILFLSLSVVAV